MTDAADVVPVTPPARTIPCNPEVARRARVGAAPDPLDAALANVARVRWHEISRLGRHGYAASRTTALGVLGLAGLLLGDAESFASLFRGVPSDGMQWLLALGVPVLAGAYCLLLARWDDDQARFGGGRAPVTLDRWREGDDASARRPAGR